MEQFEIQFFSDKFHGILNIGYNVGKSEIITDFFSIFCGEIDASNQTMKIDSKQKNTAFFREKLGEFISKYKGVVPQVQQLGSKLKKMQNDEYFFLLPPLELNTKIRYELEKELSLLNGNIIDEIEDAESEIFGRILENYELITFNLDKNGKLRIGEGFRDKRICRFCKQKAPIVSFQKEAHAISEALGNKKLILNEECDACNEFFDKNIERDFIYFHDIARTMFGIKNKDNNIPKMKGKNFEFSLINEKDLLLKAIAPNDEEVTKKTPSKVILNTGKKIKLQNIYKALCKFALSVIDSKYIEFFSKTIKWLRDEEKAEKLPKISVLHSYHFFTKRPEIALYMRNNDNKNLPFLVGEFKFAYYVYIFIVPFSEKDENSFLMDIEYQEFLDCFRQIGSINTFKFIDFSQNLERNWDFIINLKKNTKAALG